MPGFGKTIQIASPGAYGNIQPALQAAVNSAVKGDVLELPAGQFMVNSNVLITKFISIKGAGMTKTILYRSESVPDDYLSSNINWRGIFRFNINSSAKSGIVVSDITFKSKKPSVVDGDGLSLAADIGIEMVNCVDFVITRCRFENFGNGAVSIMHDDSIVGGLIFKNEFYHNVKGYDGLGLGYGVVVYGANRKWINNPRFGSSNFIFVEDNVFDYHRHSIAAGGCALYVFRYNTVKNNVAANTAHAIDAHEASLTKGDNYYSTRAIEVYNNTIINTVFKDGTGGTLDGLPIVSGKSVTALVECAIRTRGGEALIHDNYIEGYRFGVGLINTLKATYPCSYQQGYLSGLRYGSNHTGVDEEKGSGDVFIWNDKFKLYDSKSSQNIYFYNYTPNYIKNERDYHLSAKPKYTTYTYPHPLSNIIITDVENESGSIDSNPYKIYPNPASGGVLNISSDKSIVSGTILEMIDLAGVVVKKMEMVSNPLSVNIQDVANGVYLVRINNATETH
ncbi:MAG TPA: T9SS type A sorting domain-containing protein, partial [Bacteroidia bacterium]|nr:T9SS type A sorting domain-containing protein [Bacteroidia bacterium]